MNSPFHPISVRRRFAALLYDAIAAVTVLYFAAFVPVLVAGSALNAGNPLFSLYLLGFLFAYFWTGWRRGRTLGMQAWKLEIVTVDGLKPGFRTCLVRFFAAGVSLALAGLGYFVALANAERLTWHDRLSATRLRQLKV